MVDVITRERVKELSRIDPLKSWGYLVFDWAAMLAVAYLSYRYFHPVTYVIAVMLIANRQHSLLIQMHDSGHYRLFANRRLNDFVGEAICSWPMFFRMAAYRENHNLHHRYSNTERDPDFRPERFPTHRRQIYRMLLGDVTGLNTLQQLGELKRLKRSNDPGSIRLARLAYYATLVAVLTYFGLWKPYLLYWIVPLFTWLKVILRLRAIADHTGVHTLPHPFNTRTVVPNLFDLLFVAPRHCSYHLGHHLYQSIPSYHLKTLHYELMANEEFRRQARVTRGFWRLLFEFPPTEPKVAA